MKKLYLLILGTFLLFPFIVDAKTIEVATGQELLNAISNASENDTIKLTSNITLPEKATINKSLTIDLNNHDVSHTTKVFEVTKGDVLFTGTGTIKETIPDNAAVKVFGSTDPSDTNYSSLTVDKNVTLEGYIGAMVGYTAVKENGVNHYYSYGTTLTVKGKVNTLISAVDGTSGSGVYINGNLKHTTNPAKINITSTAVINSKGSAVYAAGYAIWNINGSTLIGEGSGIAVKAGTINLTNATVKATGPFVEPTIQTNGIDPTGSAIQIESNGSYAGSINININGGIYTSENGYPILEYNKQGDPLKLEKMIINDGKFKSNAGKEAISSDLIKENKDSLVIKGGSFQSDVSKYVPDDLKMIKNSDGTYTIKEKETIPPKNNENNNTNKDNKNTNKNKTYEIKNPQTYDSITTYITLGIVSLLGISVTILSKKNKFNF